MILVGIDIGTTVVKSVAFDGQGRIVAAAKRPNGFLLPRPGCAECSLERLWSLVAETLAEVTSRLPGGPRSIRAAGISGYMGGAWLIDSAGMPVRDGILWNDGRAAELLERWRGDGTLAEMFRISCNACLPGFSAPLLKWLKENEPGALEKASCVLFAKDWIRFRLTGELAAEETDIIHFPGDAVTRGYSPRVLEHAGITDLAGLLPRQLGSGEIAGRVRHVAAGETGLPEGTPVTTGLGDASACLTGAGAIRPGTACSIVGTSCLNCVTTPSPHFDPPGVGFCFLLPGGSSARCMPNTTGTLALEWFKRELLGTGKFPPLSDRQLDEEVGRVPPGARGVIFHPYLNSTGVMAPIYAPAARARFSGLGIEHTRFDMLRAVYEGVAFAMADCMEHLPASQGPVRLVGGAARSPVWRQIFADVTGRSMAISGGEEPGALAAAMLAGITTGAWRDLDEAVAACCPPGAATLPQPEAHRRYADVLRVYKHLRQDLAEESRVIARVSRAAGTRP